MVFLNQLAFGVLWGITDYFLIYKMMNLDPIRWLGFVLSILIFVFVICLWERFINYKSMNPKSIVDYIIFLLTISISAMSTYRVLSVFLN